MVNYFFISTFSYFIDASRVVGPTVLALCCLGLILFLIAATIVLSLIPIYLSSRNASPASQTVTLLIPLSSTQTFPVGNLDQNQQAVVQNNVSALP